MKILVYFLGTQAQNLNKEKSILTIKNVIKEMNSELDKTNPVSSNISQDQNDHDPKTSKLKICCCLPF